MIVPKYILPCPFTPTLSPPTQPSPGLSPSTLDPHTHHRRSTPTQCHQHQFQHPFTHLKPFLPISISCHILCNPYTPKPYIPIPDVPHTPKAFLNPYQALQTYIRTLTPISGPSYSSQALDAHPKPFIPISGTLCPHLASTHSPFAFYTYPRS